MGVFGCSANPLKHHPLLRFNSHDDFSLVLLDDPRGGGDLHHLPFYKSGSPGAARHPSSLLLSVVLRTFYILSLLDGQIDPSVIHWSMHRSSEFVLF